MPKSEVCYFAVNKTLYSYGKKLNHLFSNPKYDLKNVLNWFKINSIGANPGKFHFMILNLNVTGKIIPCSSKAKLLGVTIDNQLRF